MSETLFKFVQSSLTCQIVDTPNIGIAGVRSLFICSEMLSKFQTFTACMDFVNP